MLTKENKNNNPEADWIEVKLRPPPSSFRTSGKNTANIDRKGQDKDKLSTDTLTTEKKVTCQPVENQYGIFKHHTLMKVYSSMEGKFNNLNITKQDYFSLLVNWVQVAGCTQDHKLMSNCLDLIESNAQVTVNDLAPNMCQYLPDLYHFLVKHLKKITSTEELHQGRKENQPI